MTKSAETISMGHCTSNDATTSALADANCSDSLSWLVGQYLAEAGSSQHGRERRNRPRVPIPYVFRLTPLDEHGNPLEDEATTVVGRDLSLTGISFSFDQEPTFQRAIISLDHPEVGYFAVQAKFVWSQRTLVGLFETGCQLICRVEGHMVRGDGDSI